MVYFSNIVARMSEADVQGARHEALVLQLAEAQPLLRARDVQAAGIPSIVLTRMVQAGLLERAARGVYRRAGSDISPHASLAEVCVRVPRGVICLSSALRFHQLGTQNPGEVWLALPPQASLPRLNTPRVSVVRMHPGSMDAGVEMHSIDGVAVPIFSVAKTIADCFKFRSRIGLEVALEALKDAWHAGACSMDELTHFAALNRMSNVMRPYLESVAA